MGLSLLMKKALITGITGQDGSYLADLLLEKGYEVHGLKRRTSLINTHRIDHLFNSQKFNNRFFLHHGDLNDSSNINSLVSKIKPDEIYNLAAQSHVAVSFEMPEYTANSDGLGVLRFLEAIKNLDLINKTKFYQASTSEMFGRVQAVPQNEDTPFYPVSPYGSAKLYAHWITKNYRESYGIFACSGILFNHESPRRGETFVTRKITRGLCQIKLGITDKLTLGNLDALRDWGHAKDYVEAMWMMLQIEEPRDFVIATGEQISVEKFINISADLLGIKLFWEGEGVNRIAKDSSGSVIIDVSPKYFRPNEVETLLGDPSQANEILGWHPKYDVYSLAKEMVESDLQILEKTI